MLKIENTEVIGVKNPTTIPVKKQNKKFVKLIF